MLWLPALSTQLAVREAVGRPGGVRDAGQESIPAPVSVPVAVTVTGWLYQPFASGGRAGAVVTPGGVESY